jgi:hypothetical protein
VANVAETRGLQRCREFCARTQCPPQHPRSWMRHALRARRLRVRLDLRDGEDREWRHRPASATAQAGTGRLQSPRAQGVRDIARLRAHERKRIAPSGVGADVEGRRVNSTSERRRWAAASSCAALISARSSSNVRAKRTSRRALKSLTSSGGSSSASFRRRPSRLRRSVCVGSANRDSSDRWPFMHDHGVDARIAWTMERWSRVRASGCWRWKNGAGAEVEKMEVGRRTQAACWARGTSVPCT